MAIVKRAKVKGTKKPKKISLHGGLGGVDSLAKHVARNVCDNWWCSPLIHTVRFVIHFCVVMGILFGGAMVLSELEDPAPKGESQHQDSTSTRNGTNTTELHMETANVTEFMLALQKQYNLHCLNLDESVIEGMRAAFELYSRKIKEAKEHRQIHEQRKDRFYIFKKWFYFTNIISTTIGKRSTLYERFPP